ncbi:thiazolylpeptide-type bacteriocin precursor [Actinomadura pelletieri DSM 43383]|uniref:Thiazolylpeptide-type bacteriocin n=1 Tax=Actinomadura pelletieri DSM 43383 TaxID=1120940 RepID=A0A495QGI7_9ACTN|nr:thiazolylpeptide-type bacteriocin [Actinomadura pelletieri]RKS70995.1 thiazolylpeptide-type bacteriocin precursor [Actinomadura pelletieri DSM 43383]
MRKDGTAPALSEFKDGLDLLEAETFEIQDHTGGVEEMAAATTSCTSTTSSCTSSSGTSCCD